MRFLFFFLLTFLSTLFSENFETIKDDSNLKIITPSLRNRKTAKIKLENGLTVFIISDPEIKESAAAMAVNVGSWDDPKEYPGIAHFTEHMLFQGTNKYPDRNDFFKFILDRGGNLNAYTMPDRTVYMFSINNSAFVDGLNRFSQFFISPLFDPSAITSELFAVDQEHAKNIENDLRRAAQVWKETSNPNHPNINFSTGNSTTLSKIPREKLIEWHAKYYSANLMRLVIYTSDSIDNCLSLVTSLFTDIPSKEGKKLSNLPELSSDLQKGHLIYIKPIKDIEQLSIQWELPRNLLNDESKSAELIAYALNAGHKKSLLNVLKKENLVDDLTASVSNIGNLCSLFSISFSLTDEGVLNINKITEKTFQLLNSLKQSGVPPYLFHEMNTMAKINYEYQTRPDPFNFVEATASELLEEELSTYPNKTLLASSYSPSIIQKVLNHFTIENCQIFVVSDPNKTKVIPTKKEKWVDVEYAIEPISPSLIKNLTNLQNDPSLDLPPPNPFIPSSLSILENENKDEKPINVFQNELGTGYFIPTNFTSPEINLIFKIKTPLFSDSSKCYVLFDLFSKTLSDNLNDLSLQAKSAGLQYNMDIEKQEMILQIKGYSEKASLFLESILKQMTNLTLTKESFDNHVKFFQKSYYNSRFDLPVNQASDELTHLLYKDYPTEEEKLKILNTLTYEDVLQFFSSLFEKTYIESIFTGNLTIKNSESIWLDLQTAISKVPYKNLSNQKILSLSKGAHKTIKKTDVLGSGIILTIEENPFSFKRRAAQEILSQGLKEPFFSEMRSKQKTAYFARSWDIEKQRHLFQLFTVQSGSVSAEELLYRFEIFLDDFIQNIEKNIDRKRFEEIKENLIIQLKNPPKNLDETAQKYSLLAFDYKDFNWEEKRIQAHLNLSYEDFIALSKEFISKENKKRLAILVEGKLKENESLKYNSISTQEIVSSFNYSGALSTEEPLVEKNEK